MLYLRGTTINVMVLAGLVIALGVVVDDAIVGIENTVRRLRQHRREGSKEAPRRPRDPEASLEVRGPIVYATLIIVAAMVPIFFLTGLTGAFFSPLAASYVLAVAVSSARCADGHAGAEPDPAGESAARKRESPFTKWLQNGYERSLAPIIARPRGAYAAVALTVVAGIGVVPLLGQDLLPSFKERDFLMHWVTAPDTSGPEETRVSVRACKELRTIPGVRNCGSHIGQAFMSDEPYGIYFGENWISVDPKVDYDKTLAHVQEVVDGYPGIRRDVQTYLKERISEVLTGSSDALVVRVFGDDLDVLHAQADKVMEAMEGIDGLVEPKVELHDDIPQVEVKVDLAAAQRVGLKPGDVRRQSGVWLGGEEVGDIFHKGRAYDVQLWSIPSARDSLTDVQAVPIDMPAGGTVRLDQIADVRVAPDAEHDRA